MVTQVLADYDYEEEPPVPVYSQTTQNRSHNTQNQATVVGSSSPDYDGNGNTIENDSGHTLIYDAWNRLIEVINSSTFTIAEYAYDALGRRIIENDRDLYYSKEWQVIEERDHSTRYLIAENVWGPFYVDTMIVRNYDTDDDGIVDERLRPWYDANYNVTALVDDLGDVVERYAYDPYGEVTVVGSMSNQSVYDWRYLFQGGRYDYATGKYHFRNREYDPELGRWMQQDPLRNLTQLAEHMDGTLVTTITPLIEYIDGMNLYQYVTSDPISHLDPSGLCQEDCNLDFGLETGQGLSTECDPGFRRMFSSLKVNLTDLSFEWDYSCIKCKGGCPVPEQGCYSVFLDMGAGNQIQSIVAPDLRRPGTQPLTIWTNPGCECRVLLV